MADETDMGGGSPSFGTTLWTQVVRAADPSSPGRREALEALFTAYWRPLYAFARRRGAGVDDAKDHVQGFFARVLEKEWLAAADPARGKFRTFLLTAFIRYCADEGDRAHAQKRGGGRRTLSLDWEGGERGLSIDPADPSTPEQLFDRDWALTLLSRCMQRLKEEAPLRHDLLQASLDGDSPSTETLAQRFELQPHDVKNYLFRARRRLRALMIQEVASQLDHPGEAEAELARLWDSLKPRAGGS